MGLDLTWEINAVATVPMVAVVTAALHARAALDASWAHLTVLVGGASMALSAGVADVVVPNINAAVAGAFLELVPSGRWDEPPATMSLPVSSPLSTAVPDTADLDTDDLAT